MREEVERKALGFMVSPQRQGFVCFGQLHLSLGHMIS